MLNISRWNIILIITVALLSVVYALPNVLPKDARGWLETHMPSWMPGRTVTLGLDLQGGSHLLLEVKTDVALNDRMNALVDQMRTELRKKDIPYENLGAENGKAQVTITKPSDIEAARAALAGMDAGLLFDVQGNTLRVSLSEDAVRERKKQVVEQSIEIVRRRIDETGTREPSIQREGENRIVVQLPGVSDPEHIKSLLGKTAKLTFQFVNDEVPQADIATHNIPPGFEALPSAEDPQKQEVVSRRVILTGETLTDAQATFEQGMPVVSFAFDGMGGRKFADATSTNVGKRFAIILDNQVISAPVIREPILGGRGIISGSFSVQGAQDLALLLRAGALPAPLVVLEERTVGAGLGSDSIKSGMSALLVGLVLIVAIMVMTYGIFGVFSIISLFFNLTLILTCMSLLGATLTLPGIAGIMLVIGTSVDSNVLIYERMRDEYKQGRTLLGALDAGYRRAMSAIIDANVTHLIGASLMFWLGSGPIKGFGVTLSLGILTSLFTAIELNRLMVVTWVKLRRPKALPI